MKRPIRSPQFLKFLKTISILSLLLFANQCNDLGLNNDQTIYPKEDPFNIINEVTIEDARILERKTLKLEDNAFYLKENDPKDPKDELIQLPKESKIDPLLQKKINSVNTANATETVVVHFQDNYRIPRFPEPKMNESRDSEYNKRAMKAAQDLIESIKREREKSYDRTLANITGQYGAKVLEKFWLINGVVMEIPLKSINALAEQNDILKIEIQQTEDYPPQNSNPDDDVQDGRARMASDPYFNLGLPLGWIGLLDTGVRGTHTQFNSPDHVDYMRDCVNGGSNCNTGSSLNPNDDCWNHGTSSAGIITGNNRQGNQYRGVTEITLDNFKVYPSTWTSGSCTGGLNTTAAVRGFQQAVAVLDRVIVAEMQGSGGSGSSISVAADNAFDAGAVIIAANGNFGPNSGTVRVPANAHKVIGVGNFDVDSGTQISSQGRGPASDNRYKPDIQAPTNTETASNASNTALRVFGGTSGATPYAAGAAALLRNWMRGSSFSIDPGQIYSHLILAGQSPYPFTNTVGAGRIRLGTGGIAWWGKVSIINGQTIDIPINPGSRSFGKIEGALWWPETEAGSHDDIDLYLVSPAGTILDSSISIPSVFERATRNTSISGSGWVLRIRGYSVSGSQTVYWSARMGN